MISITLDDLEHYALPYRPDYGRDISATFRFEAGRSESLTKREARRPLGETLRVVELQLGYSFPASEAAAFRSALRVIAQDDGEKLVRIPFWPSEYLPGFAARWWMDFTEVEQGLDDIAFLNEPGAVVTLLGRIKDNPSFLLTTGNRVAATVRWEESSPASEAMVLDEQEWTAGPSIAARTIYLFPFEPSWASELDAGKMVIEVRRTQLGQGRESASQAYPQIGRREPVFPFALRDDEPAKLLRFFQDRKGSVEAFWLPGQFAEVQLAEDTDAGSADIVLTEASLIADRSHIAFYTENGTVVTRAIVARDGNTLTLSSSPGTLSASSTSVCSLMLARFSGNEITLGFNGPLTTAKIGFTEVSQEYVTPSGETYGTTLGNLPAEAVLIQMTHGSEVFRFTSYERALTDGDENVWTPEKLEAGEIVDGDAFEALDSQIRFRHTEGSPMSRLLNGTLMERVEVLIKTCTPGETVTNVATLFRGWLTKPRRTGAFWDINLTSFGKLFDKQIPSSQMQKGDNFTLFKSAFDHEGLDPAEWTFTGSVTAVDGRTLTVQSLTWPGGSLPSIPSNYFALGRAEKPDGTRVIIISSTAWSSGSMEIVLAEEIDVDPEAGWKFIPGYNGQWNTADNRFNSPELFGGFPRMPARTPSLTPPKKSSSNDSKK